MDKSEVLVIGRNCIDHISIVEDFPDEDQKVPMIQRMVEGGGQGGTSSCCIAKLGGRIIHIGRLGDDPEGVFCRKRLHDFKVDTRFVETVEGGVTPVAYIFITRSNGRRTIVYEHNLLPKLTFEDILPALANQPDVILLDPETTYLGSPLKSHVGEGVKIVYDCERWRQGSEDMMNCADYFIPSHEFLNTEKLNLASSSFVDKMATLRSKVQGQLIVTRGELGAYYFSGKHLIQVVPPEIAVKDTLGAGDNFHGAFALAISRGFSLDEAVKFSVAVASLSCRSYGGREGIPDCSGAMATATDLEERMVESFD